MRPLVIELLHERIEARLLLEDVRARRARRLVLEREVQPLMPAVLLGMARCNPLEADAEAEPPHRQLAEPVQRMRGGEGYAVVRADCFREPIFLKRALEHGECVPFLR